jgi:hypothetical protein
MRPNRVALGAVFLAGVLLYLPTARYRFVQDDRAIIVANPSAHSIGAGLRGFGQPYWPRPSEAGLYRPVTILSLAIDWAVSQGSAAWMHIVNALWHGLVCLLVTLVLSRWLPAAGTIAAGLVFAWHPVHVEGVANIVSRNELLAAAGMFGAVLAARRGWWAVAVCAAALAMLSKELAVVTGVVLMADYWLCHREARRPYPTGFWVALGVVTVVYVALWTQIGRAGAADVAAPFLHATAGQRLMIAFPANLRAAGLLFWPSSLSADYSPQVIALHTGLSLAAMGGILVVLAAIAAAWFCRSSSPAISFVCVVAAITYLPTSNLLFPSGVILAERDLYLPVILAAGVFGAAVAWTEHHWPSRRGLLMAGVVLLALVGRSWLRLPAWEDNRALLLTLLEDHPESYRGQQSAAAVLAGIGTQAAVQEAAQRYARADSLFGGDPHLKAGFALFLLDHGDTVSAKRLVGEALALLPEEPVAIRVQQLLSPKK